MRLHEIVLLEKRRNAPMNPKTGVMDALAKYAGQKNVFVTFTHDVGSASHGGKNTYSGKAKDGGDNRHQFGIRAKGEFHNAAGAKFGINPKSEYDTPLGIYGYPVDYVIEKKGDVEFAANRPYMFIFRASGHLLDLSNYTEADFDRDLKALIEKTRFYASDRWLEKTKDEAMVDTPAGHFWNASRLIAIDVATNLNDAAKDYDDFGEPPFDEEDYDDYEEYEEAVREWEEEQRAEAEDAEPHRPMVQWARLLREIGYDGVVDYDGDGIIHQNEPTQAVFFSKQTLKVVELIHNRYESGTEWTDERVWREKPHLFLNQMRQGKLSFETIVGFLRKNPYTAEKIKWADLPEAVQQYVLKDPTSFADEYTFPWIAEMPLTMKQVAKILTERPQTVVAIKMTPSVRKFIIQNFKTFARYFGSMKLTAEERIELIKQDPMLIQQLQKDASSVDPKIMAFIIDTQPLETVREFFNNRYNVERTKPEMVARYFTKFISKASYPNVSHWLETLMDINQRAFIICYRMQPKRVAVRFAKDMKSHYRSDGEKRYRACLKVRPDIAPTPAA